MSIPVTCPGCHTRFRVGDQHAGKTGACPKCKNPIQIPEPGDEVVIHAPELEAGAKDAQGRSVLKPIKRQEARLSVNIGVAVVGLGVLVLALAWLVGRSDLGESQLYALAGGAILLGPLLSYAGYTFLSDDELGTYAGASLLWRSLSCGLVYAFLWGVYLYLGSQLFGDQAYYEQGLNAVQLMGLGAVVLGIGTFAAYVCFDLETGAAFFHAALYFLVTAGLRFVMGLPLLPGMPGGPN